jgi:hypothetical protein
VINSLKYWRLTAACGLIAVGGASLQMRPAQAKGSPQAQKAKPRFFDGTLTDAHGEQTNWLCIDGTRVYGTTLPDTSLGDFRFKWFGGFRNSAASGRLYDTDSDQVGTFSGQLNGAVVAGSVSSNDGDGTFSVTEAVRDSGAMNDFAGRFLDEGLLDDGVRFTLRLTKGGIVTGSANARGLKLGSMRGKWMIDTQGFLWWLPLSLNANRLFDVSRYPLLQRKVVSKLAIGINGNEVTLLNPFDRSTVVTTFRKQ